MVQKGMSTAGQLASARTSSCFRWTSSRPSGNRTDGKVSPNSRSTKSFPSTAQSVVLPTNAVFYA